MNVERDVRGTENDEGENGRQSKEERAVVSDSKGKKKALAMTNEQDVSFPK